MPTRRDDRSPEARAYRGLYKTAAWRQIRLAHLQSNPLCAMCLKGGRKTHARNVNHVTPHKGDWSLFISGPLESLCDAHHNRDVQGVERRGFSLQVDTNGYPVSPNHPANRADVDGRGRGLLSDPAA